MAIIRWQPWQELETMRRQFDQLFDELTPVTRDAFVRARSEMTWTPAIELKDGDRELTLRAELPGVDAKDLDIQVSEKAVSISGEYRSEKKAEEPGFFRTEFRYGNFRRVVPLPIKVQNNQVKAEFQNGILSLTLPKLEVERPTVVKVSLGDTQTATTHRESDAAVEATNPTATTPETTAVGDVWANA